MRNPTLYKPGMENKFFSEWIMVEWILYSFIHGFWVFMICHYSLNQFTSYYNSPTQADGKTISLWLSGHTVYSICVFVANLIVFHRSYCHQATGGVMYACMILALFLSSAFTSSFEEPTTFPDVLGTFPYFMENKLIWLTVLLACLGVTAGELFLRYLQDL